MSNFLFLGGLGGIEIIVMLLLPLILWVVALVDVLNSKFKESNDKLIWVLVILLFPIFGAFLYFIIGRKQKA
jgi:hypothetical protein